MRFPVFRTEAASRHITAVSLVVLLATPVAAVPAAAQMPGVPVLQNAFTAPGIVVAANAGSVDDVKGAALAGSWTPGAGRGGRSAGAGRRLPVDGDDAVAWGARLAVPVPRPSGSNFGVGVFVGFGGAEPDAGRMTQLPAGVAVGWRRAIGTTRALSLYAAPFFNWSRVSLDGETRTGEHVRVSAGLDFAVNPSWGVTVGVETGQEANVDEAGPTGIGLGLGLSYAFGRGR